MIGILTENVVGAPFNTSASVPTDLGLTLGNIILQGKRIFLIKFKTNPYPMDFGVFDFLLVKGNDIGGK